MSSLPPAGGLDAFVGRTPLIRLRAASAATGQADQDHHIVRGQRTDAPVTAQQGLAVDQADRG